MKGRLVCTLVGLGEILYFLKYRLKEFQQKGNHKIYRMSNTTAQDLWDEISAGDEEKALEMLLENPNLDLSFTNAGINLLMLASSFNYDAISIELVKRKPKLLQGRSLDGWSPLMFTTSLKVRVFILFTHPSRY